MKIGGFQKVTLVDFPAHIAAIVFVKGCNFRCPFCFNRDLILGNLPTISQRSNLCFLKKRKNVLDGVVITGGEPTVQPDLEEFIRKIKKLGYKIKLDTNGALPDVLKWLIKKKLIDYVALDFKAPLGEGYTQAVGLEEFEPKIIVSAIKLLVRSKIPFELRTTVVPGLHDKKILAEMARQLKKIAGKRKIKWFLQEFKPVTCLVPEYEKRKPYSQEKMVEFLKAVRLYHPEAELRAS